MDTGGKLNNNGKNARKLVPVPAMIVILFKEKNLDHLHSFLLFSNLLTKKSLPNAFLYKFLTLNPDPH